MVKKKKTIILILILVFSTITAVAQPRPIQRTEEFDLLNVFVGKWQTEGKIFPGEGRPVIKTKGEPTFEWVMGKTWLMLDTGKGRMQGHGYTTWDEESGQYMFFWFDNFVTKPIEYHGSWQDAKTLVFNREKISGETKSFLRITWRFISENEMNVVREYSTDGKIYTVRVEMKYKKIEI